MPLHEHANAAAEYRHRLALLTDDQLQDEYSAVFGKQLNRWPGRVNLIERLARKARDDETSPTHD